MFMATSAELNTIKSAKHQEALGATTNCSKVQEAAVAPAVSSGVCYLQNKCKQDQLETMQQAMQQFHATSLNYNQHISVLRQNWVSYSLATNSYQKLHTILYTLPYLGFHASCRPSSGLKSRVWPLRLLVLFTVIARPELRFHNHLLISTAWIKGQPDVSLTRLQKRDGTARCVRVITNKEAASPRTYRQSPSLWSHLLSSLLCICPCRLSSNCHLRCTSCTRS